MLPITPFPNGVPEDSHPSTKDGVPFRAVRGSLVLLPVVVLVGCGGNDSSSTATQPTTTAAQVPKKETTVVVHETEYSLDPSNADAGATGLVKIKVVNDGKLAHALAVEGPNGRVDLDGSLEPGSSATMEVDLDKPGSYTWFCPLDDHRAKGMSGTIRVSGSEPASAPEGQSTTATQTTPTQTVTQTQTTTQVQTQTQTQTQTSPTPTQTETTPTATTGGDGY